MQEMRGKQRDAENAGIKDLDLSQRKEKLNILNRLLYYKKTKRLFIA